MNKVVITGNGFDLAHGLPTGYGDFMKYLTNKILIIKEYGSSSRLVPIGRTIGNVNNNIVILQDEDNIDDPWIGAIYDNEDRRVLLKAIPKDSSKSIYFSSLFNDFKNDGKWSDLENHYFDTLKKIISKVSDNKRNIESILSKIDIINKEFDHLKKLLYLYLKEEIENKIEDKRDESYISESKLFNGIRLPHNKELEDCKNEVYFFTFNYTGKKLKHCVSMMRDYGINIPIDPIHIHGDLENEDNPIIFGYGDDNSDEYKQIQDLKENDLLKNFKTFQYLRSNRYRQVLGLLEQKTSIPIGNIGVSHLSDEDIYIQVIGHSLDIGDRTLLKTIFQHPNVKHIELTYHDKEENYFENLYNVSRIFDDNTLMREKIIPLEDTYNVTTGMTLNQAKKI